LLHECMGMHSLMKAGRCHQHTSYKVLAKPALRMLNGVLTFYYWALNCSCYYGDSAPGGGLFGILPLDHFSHMWTSLPGVTERLGENRGLSGPSFVPVGSFL